MSPGRLRRRLLSCFPPSQVPPDKKKDRRCGVIGATHTAPQLCRRSAINCASIMERRDSTLLVLQIGIVRTHCPETQLFWGCGGGVDAGAPFGVLAPWIRPREHAPRKRHPREHFDRRQQTATSWWKSRSRTGVFCEPIPDAKPAFGNGERNRDGRFANRLEPEGVRAGAVVLVRGNLH